MNESLKLTNPTDSDSLTSASSRAMSDVLMTRSSTEMRDAISCDVARLDVSMTDITSVQSFDDVMMGDEGSLTSSGFETGVAMQDEDGDDDDVTSDTSGSDASLYVSKRLKTRILRRYNRR